MTFAKFGRQILSFSNRTLEEHKQDMQRAAHALPRIIEQIDAAVARARRQISAVKPLDLLIRAATEYLVAQIGTEVEADLTHEHALAYRMIDYVQNVIASTPPETAQQALSDEKWTELRSTIKEIFDLVHGPYQIARSANAQLTDPTYDHRLDEFMFRAQLYWSGVRGDRFAPHAIEQLRAFLTPHDAVLHSTFRVGADAVVAGIEALQESMMLGAQKAGRDLAAFQQAVFAEAEKLIEGGSTSPPLDLLKAVARSEKNAAISEDIFARLFGAGRFDVGRVTGLPDAFLRELSWSPGEEQSFFAPGDFCGWPLRIWPSHRRPFLMIEDRYYCFDAYFHDDIYRSIQRTVKRLRPDYGAEWNEKQVKTSERLPLELMTEILGKARVHQHVYYRFKPSTASKSDWFECDALIAFDEVLFVCEVKAGSATYTSPATDFEAHITSARELIEKPLLQGRRFVEYLESQTEVLIFDKEHQETARLRSAEFKSVFVCAITLDHLTEMAAQVEHLGPLGVNVQPGSVWAFSLDDLRVFRDVFHNPLVFAHYASQRVRAAASPAIKLDDELDHIGLYLEHNDYRAHAETMMVGNAPTFHGYRSALDRFYHALVVDPTNAVPPSQKMPIILREIIDVMAVQEKVGRVGAANALLDLTSTQRGLLEQGVKVAVDEARNDLTRPVSIASFTLACSVTGHPYQASDIRRHTLANAMMLGQDERLLLELKFDEEGRLDDVAFEFLSSAAIQDSVEKAKVQNVAEGLLQQRLKRAGDVGRNELCPCGSGKKFKNCHGK
ncbi:MAG TPA: SEC-C domain-containing protein [Thermoanaerobaculia bacterium]|nr:SEC-C domain-containing protein [Thermoanaerobaculia bacterium]